MLTEHWSKLLNALSSKIDIVGEIDILEIATNPYAVLADLEKYVNVSFKPNQRLVITQIDNLFFTKGANYSVSFYNLFVLLTHLGLPTEHVLILTNQNVHDEIAYLSNVFHVTPPKVFASLYNTIQTTEQTLNEPKINCQSIQYSYSCLNGLKRSARILLLCALEEQSLIGKGLVSWNFAKENVYTKSSKNDNQTTALPLLLPANDSIVNDMLFMNQQGRELFDKHYEKFANSSYSHPLIASFDKVAETKIFQPMFLQNALAYVVSETVVDYPYAYLSEKTFKGFLIKRPMIIFGAPYSIARIQDLGFKTWGNFWDESYDSLPSVADRANAICNIVQDLSKLSIEQLQDICIKMQDVLEYNYYWYFNEFAKNQLDQLVKNTDV